MTCLCNSSFLDAFIFSLNDNNGGFRDTEADTEADTDVDANNNKDSRKAGKKETKGIFFLIVLIYFK